VKKKISFLLLLIYLLLFLPSYAEEAPKVYVNGSQVSAPSIEQDGEVYVSVQSLAKALKISVKWDPNNKVISINGKAMDCKPLLKSNTIYVPAMALGNQIGAEVEMDYGQNIIKITTGKTPQPNPTKGPTPAVTKAPTPVASNPTPAPTAAPTAKISMFVPTQAENDNFRVTVTNLVYSSIIKNYYTPKSGNRFCTLNLSQQNISANVQIYTGTFSLVDKDGVSYDYLEGLSNFWLQVLQPGGTNFGHLVYEIPATSVPDKLILYSIDQPSLTLNLNLK